MKPVNHNVYLSISHRVNNLIPAYSHYSIRKDKIGMNVYWPIHRQIKIRVHIQVDEQVEEDLT